MLAQLTAACWLPVLMRDSLRCNSASNDARVERTYHRHAAGRCLCSSTTAKVTEVNVGGMPLGLLPEAEYDEVTLSLSPGDMVIFASDGIHESMKKRAEEFGVTA